MTNTLTTLLPLLTRSRTTRALCAWVLLGSVSLAAPAAVTSQAPPSPGGVIELPLELRAHRPTVQLTIEGHGEFTFIVDTGSPAAATIDIDLARSLGMRLQEEFRAPRAVGSATAPLERARCEPFALVLAGRRFVVLEPQALTLSALRPFGAGEVSGLLGVGFLQSFVTELDGPGGALRLHPKAGFALPEPRAGEERTTLAIEARGGRITTNGALTVDEGAEPLAMRIGLDTGLTASLLVLRPFAERQRLYLELDGYHVVTVGGGVGGAREGSLLRGRRFELAGADGSGALAIERPLVTLSRGAGDVLPSRHVDGKLGGRFLREHRVFLELERGRATLDRRAHAPLEDHEDRSGLFLVAEAGDQALRVLSVLPGSPAALAGLRAGDRVTAVDGRSVSWIGLDGVRERLTREGAAVELGLLQDAKRTVARLVLAQRP